MGVDFKKKRNNTNKRNIRKAAPNTPEDEIITTNTDVMLDDINTPAIPETKPDVTFIPFKDGIVHSAFGDADTAHWIKSEETDLLWEAIDLVHQVNGIFVGDVSIKTSFIKNNKGVALL